MSKTFMKKITERYKKPLNKPMNAVFLLMKNATYCMFILHNWYKFNNKQNYWGKFNKMIWGND